MTDPTEALDRKAEPFTDGDAQRVTAQLISSTQTLIDLLAGKLLRLPDGRYVGMFTVSTHDGDGPIPDRVQP